MQMLAIYLFIYLGRSVWLVGPQFPDQGLNLGPKQ